ncbi:DUF2177 family protein [Rhizobium sp. L1K21]|uniref:DUF2177 family protein n=1 Tax=Rhizobium sp. L1K21 TaxID=2954933 RepID=UPI002092D41E|nr:DUF2177 family protein [Rhizobium sp. L1K21]MCO6185258.1 DUF2177 family protein [Rhizobium sp. L1K21]
MKAYVKAAIGLSLVFLVIDFIWLSQISIGFYRTHIGSHLAEEPNLVAAAVFYVLYLGGILYFAVAPAIIRGTMASAAFSGALMGLVAYGTYDLTNMATMSDWPLIVTVVDMIWGAAITATAAAAGYWFAMFEPKRSQKAAR